MVLVAGLLLASAASVAAVEAPATTSADADADTSAGPRGERPAVRPVTTPRRGAIDFPWLPDRCYDDAHGGATRTTPCRINRFDPARPSLVLWGDSHAQQYLPPVRSALRERDVNLVLFTSGSCPPAWVARRRAAYPSCEAKNRNALDWVRRHRADGQRVTVLLSSSWSRWRALYRVVRADERAGRPPSYDDAILRVIELSHEATPPLFRSLGRLGVRVDVVGISGGYPPRDKAPCEEGDDPYRCPLPRGDVIGDEVATERYLARQVRKLRAGHRFVDTSDAYCDASQCFGTVDGLATFYDSAHLGKSFTSTLTSYFEPTARRAAGRS